MKNSDSGCGSSHEKKGIPWMTIYVAASLPLHFGAVSFPIRKQLASSPLSFYSTSSSSVHLTQQYENPGHETDNYRSQSLNPGLYLIVTPIRNLEDITLRALRMLNSTDVILSEDTRHSGKLLHRYNIKSPLMSHPKFIESQREPIVPRRLKQGEIVALISVVRMSGISDPGMEMVKLCVCQNVPVVPILGPCDLVKMHVQQPFNIMLESDVHQLFDAMPKQLFDAMPKRGRTNVTLHLEFEFGDIDCKVNRFDDHVTRKLEDFASRAKIIHIDIDFAEIRKNE